MARYQILDEPRPGALAHAAVRPFWPLLACMVGGPWIGWPWFVLNSFAVGGTRRWAVLGTAAAGMAGSVAMILAFSQALLGGIGDLAQRLWLLAIVVWKLAVAYVLYMLEHRDIELFEYYRGQVRNGVVVVLAAYLLEPRILGELGGFARLLLR